MESIIGKKYVAIDNSYSLNLTDQKREHYLAGTGFDNPKEAIIVSEPYKQDVECIVSGIKSYDFINVKYEQDTIRVMYHKQAVEADLEERIRKNNNRWFLM